MAFSFFELPSGQDTAANPPSVTKKWKAVGSVDENFVNAYAYGATPSVVATYWGTLFRQDIRTSRVAYNQYTVDVPYGVGSNSTGQWTWDFDTTGGTVHITNAKQEVARYPSGTAPNQQGAIAVDGDEVHGIDIVVPAMKINVRYRHPLGVITLSQAKFLSNLTGKVNTDTFLTFAPGEVLFLGARGSDGTDAEAEVSYQFAMSANATGLSIGAIAGIAKKGHEAIWTRYEDKVDTAGGGNKPVRVAKYVYVDRVYDTVSMSGSLGFGG